MHCPNYKCDSTAHLKLTLYGEYEETMIVRFRCPTCKMLFEAVIYADEFNLVEPPVEVPA